MGREATSARSVEEGGAGSFANTTVGGGEGGGAGVGAGGGAGARVGGGRQRLRVFERAAVVRAADFGLERMRVLLEEYEPRLYRRGAVLGAGAPARYVAAFNAQGARERKLAQFGYAALQATSMLVRSDGDLDEEDDAEERGGGGGGGRRKGRGWREAQVPRVSLRHTALGRQCPTPAAPRPCPSAARARFRSFDGRCNHPDHPQRGAAGTPLRRLLPPHYKDGLERARDAASGGPLPSARAVSVAVHGARDVDLAAVTHLLMQWGQLVDHDLTASAQTRGFNASVPKCCTDDGSGEMPSDLQHPDCMPIAVAPDDWFLGPLGVRCMEFVRSGAAPRPGCALGPRDQLNRVTAFLDASAVYGSSSAEARRLRLRRGGLLRYRRVHGRLPLLPPATHDVDLCAGVGSHGARDGAGGAHAPHAPHGAHGAHGCFDAGDGRVNEQPGLIAAHALLLRLHNRVATRLAHLNAHWDDERLFQEARRVVGAVMQHVTYREFLPLVLGPEVVKSFGLGLVRRGYFEGYDPRVNPSVANAFATAAFRFGHSLVQNSLLRCDRSHRPLPANFSLHEELTKPAYLHHVGSVDELLLGMCAQPAQKRDEFITEQLTNHLFQTSHLRWGMDLAAINIQRGRDHGLAPYNTWREACGLQPFTNWVQMLKVMSPETQRKFKKIYRDIDDVDLFPAAMSEKPVSGGLVGPTFACILAQQFSNLRKGDRFWYENGGFESSFTPAQLQQLRKITLARILCDNLDSIDTIQPFVFLAADNDRNKYMPCEKIPNFDLTPWTEHRIVNEYDSYHHENHNDHENHYGESSTTKHPPYHSHHHDSYHTTQEHHYHKPTESHQYYEHTTESHHHSHYQQPHHKPIINDYEKPILLPPEQDSSDHYGSYSSSKPSYKPKPQNNYSITYIYEFDLEHKPKPTPTPTYSKPKPSINPTPSYTVIHVHHSVEHHPSHGHSNSYHSSDHSKPGYHPSDHSKPHHHEDSYLPNYSHGQKGDTYTSQTDSYLPPKLQNTYRPIKTTTQKPVFKPYYPTEDSDRPPSIDNYGPDFHPSDNHKPPADSYRPPKPNVQDYGYYKPVTDGYKPPDTPAYKPPHIYGSSSYSNSYRPTKPTTTGLNKPSYGPYENYGTPKPTIDKYGTPKPGQNYYKPSQFETSTETYPKPEIIYSDPKPSVHEHHHSSNTNLQQYPKPIRPLKGSSQYTVIEVQHDYSRPEECKDPSHLKPSSIVNADSAHDSYLPPPSQGDQGNYGYFASDHSKPFTHHSHNSKPKPSSNLGSEDTPIIIFTSVSKSSGSHRLKGNQGVRKNSSSEATSSSNSNLYNSQGNEENINHDFTKYVSLNTSPELPTPGLGAEARNTAHKGADNSDEWTFDAKEVDDFEEIPEVPYLPSDPESVRELPHPIIEENDEYSGEEEEDEDEDLDSRSLW